MANLSSNDLQTQELYAKVVSTGTKSTTHTPRSSPPSKASPLFRVNWSRNRATSESDSSTAFKPRISSRPYQFPREHANLLINANGRNPSLPLKPLIPASLSSASPLSTNPAREENSVQETDTHDNNTNNNNENRPSNPLASPQDSPPLPPSPPPLPHPLHLPPLFLLLRYLTN